MSGLLTLVALRLQPAFDLLEPGADPVLRPSSRADFQVNGALPLAKRVGRKAPILAEEIAAGLRLDPMFDLIDVAGPGFINLTVSAEFITDQLYSVSTDDALGLAQAVDPLTVVIDYSAPNVAKEMHVGHLHGTIIGDALCRLLGAVGHDVIRENHVGDWGTPFGMLIEHLVDLGEDEAAHELSVGDLDVFYRQARAKFDSDDSLKDRSRRRVVALQSGDAETRRLWTLLVEQSVTYFESVYRRLGVLLEGTDVVGESFYNFMLADVVSDLRALGLLVESDGAQCVFPPGFVNREDQPLPLIVQKSDGGFGYAATDLAAVRDRVDRLGADVILYVVGAPQAQHFAMVFEVARLAGWLRDEVAAVHVSFGNVLGSDRRMFKTRSGDTVKLAALLDEAVARAGRAVAAKNPDLSEAERDDLARIIGIGAVKYADLSNDRTRDYIFDWDRMLAFDGNTAPYLQYAYTRIQSILRKTETTADPLKHFSIVETAERSLAIELLGFDEAVWASVDSYSPHKLCTYLFDLASAFTDFYEACPVLKAADPAIRDSRVALCQLTARILRRGLGLLGIEAPRRM